MPPQFTQEPERFQEFQPRSRSGERATIQTCVRTFFPPTQQSRAAAMRDITARAHPSRRAQRNLRNSQSQNQTSGPKMVADDLPCHFRPLLKVSPERLPGRRGEMEAPRRAPLLVDLRPGSVSFFLFSSAVFLFLFIIHAFIPRISTPSFVEDVCVRTETGGLRPPASVPSLY